MQLKKLVLRMGMWRSPPPSKNYLYVSYETLHSYMKMSYKQFINCLKKSVSLHGQTYFFETPICWPEFEGENANKLVC